MFTDVTFKVGTWYHMAMVYSSVDKHVLLYVNGDLQGRKGFVRTVCLSFLPASSNRPCALALVYIPTCMSFLSSCHSFACATDGSGLRARWYVGWQTCLPTPCFLSFGLVSKSTPGRRHYHRE
jgi:hypothetical protein